MAYQPPILANPPAKPALNTPGYSPYPQLDMAQIEATLRAEAAKRGLPYDPSDLDDVNRNYSNSGGTTTSGDYNGALNLVLDKYNQRVSNVPNSPDGKYHKAEPWQASNNPANVNGGNRSHMLDPNTLTGQLTGRQLTAAPSYLDGMSEPTTPDFRMQPIGSDFMADPIAESSKSSLPPELQAIIDTVKSNPSILEGDSRSLEGLNQRSPNANANMSRGGQFADPTGGVGNNPNERKPLWWESPNERY